MIQCTHTNTHCITSLPPFFLFLSFSLPSCPIIFVPTDCMSQTFCHPTEVCQWQITLIKENPLTTHYELPPTSKRPSVMLWQMKWAGMFEGVGGCCWCQGQEILYHGPLGHYIYKHAHTYWPTPVLCSHFIFTQFILFIFILFWHVCYTVLFPVLSPSVSGDHKCWCS